jgi:hypothetical protein
LTHGPISSRALRHHHRHHDRRLLQLHSPGEFTCAQPRDPLGSGAALLLLLLLMLLLLLLLLH